MLALLSPLFKEMQRHCKQCRETQDAKDIEPLRNALLNACSYDLELL